MDLTHPTTSANCGADDTTSADLADAAAAYSELQHVFFLLESVACLCE